MAHGSGQARGKAVTAVASLMLLAGADAPSPTRYIGLCEVSAAAKLDATHFVVASDDRTSLSIYARGQSKPISGPDLGDVTDIEGAARIGDTIYWLTSHSYNNAGEDKKKRKVLLATAVDGLKLTVLKPRVTDFRDTVMTALGLTKAALPTFNIEGLAATPDGALLVGLRAPLAPGDGAYVARIENAAGLLAPSPARATTKRYVLPLGARGIRSIERVGSGAQAYLIVAGASAKIGGPAPALFWWDGESETVTPGPVVPTLPNITPEALIAWGPHDAQLLWDNEAGCKDKNRPANALDENYWFPSVDLRF